MTSGYLALCLSFVLGWLSHCLWIWATDKKDGEEDGEERGEE